MTAPYLIKENVQNFIKLALQEDLGSGDYSAMGIIPQNAEAHAHLVIKEEGIIAGLSLAEQIFHTVDSQLKTTFYKKDGDTLDIADPVMEVVGSAQSILASERLVLNCLQRMSGIATKTRHMKSMISGTKVKLLDTRKTTPNFRLMEKWAVKIGGGHNHRFGLDDMIMLKDNHIDFAGGVEAAILQTRKFLQAQQRKLKIVIEVRNREELNAVLAVGHIDRILLDNMLPSEIKNAVNLIAGRYETEASGGISEKNISEIAESGVDFISVGALTTSFKSIDMSLKAQNL